MGDETILPCPFCGSTDLQVNKPEVGRLHYFVFCACGVDGPRYGNRERAIEAWNRRATPPVPPVEAPVLSRSMLKRQAIQRGEPMPTTFAEAPPVPVCEPWCGRVTKLGTPESEWPCGQQGVTHRICFGVEVCSPGGRVSLVHLCSVECEKAGEPCNRRPANPAKGT